MKKLHRNDMKKIRGGEDSEITCLRGCFAAYNLCLTYSTVAYCTDYRNRCRWRCLGCNPICP
jgi:hypothetical protein